MSSQSNVIADYFIASLLRDMDLVLALHDAKLIDKNAVANRWRETAARLDLDLSDNVRNHLIQSALGLETSGGDTIGR